MNPEHLLRTKHCHQDSPHGVKGKTMEFNRALRTNPILHIVLVSPQIAPNVGNIARTCAGASFRLHLVQPLGFTLDDRYLKRAGLDYWPQVELFVHRNFDVCRESINHHCTWLISRKGSIVYSQARFHRFDMLVFGCETTGLPEHILQMYPGRVLCIPQSSAIRSYNLATSVGIVAMEALRQITRNYRRSLKLLKP